MTWSISSKELSVSLGAATILSSIISTCISNSINSSCLFRREADCFGAATILVLLVGTFGSFDRVRDDTGLSLDLVRDAIAFGSAGGFAFLVLQTGGLGNCSCRSIDCFFFFPFDVNENEGPGGLYVIVMGGVSVGRSRKHVLLIASALVEQFVRSCVACMALVFFLLLLRFLGE